MAFGVVICLFVSVFLVRERVMFGAASFWILRVEENRNRNVYVCMHLVRAFSSERGKKA